MPVADWTTRLRELVEKGPVPFSVAQTEMARLVPPGRAFRDAERYIEWGRAKDGSTKVDGELTDVEVDGRIRRGQMRMAYIAIWTQQKHGRVEFYEQDGVKMIRLGANPWAKPKPKAKSKAATQRPIQTEMSKGTREHPAPPVTRMKPWTLRVWRRVAEGPVPQEALIADAMRLVPPGIAFRKSDANAARLREKRGGNERRWPDEQKAQDQKIRSGQRSVVTGAIAHFIDRGRIVRETRDDSVWVVAGPNFWVGQPPEDSLDGQ